MCGRKRHGKKNEWWGYRAPDKQREREERGGGDFKMKNKQM